MTKGDVHIHVSPVINPEIVTTINPSIKQKSETSVSAIQRIEMPALPDFNSDLTLMKEAIEDFKEDKRYTAAEHEQDLNQLIRDIDRMQKDITELKMQPDSNDAEKRSIMKRIKKRWDGFAERAKQCYYVVGMGEKIAKAAAWIDKLDCDNWFS